MSAHGRMSLALVFLSAFALPAQAIDAARSLRPMVYISDKPKASNNDDGRDRALQQTTPTGKTTGAVSTLAPGKPEALPPGAVVTDTASGKPYVAVKTNSNCTVSAASGDLEAQLRACAGIKPTPR